MPELSKSFQNARSAGGTQQILRYADDIATNSFSDSTNVILTTGPNSSVQAPAIYVPYLISGVRQTGTAGQHGTYGYGVMYDADGNGWILSGQLLMGMFGVGEGLTAAANKATIDQMLTFIKDFSAEAKAPGGSYPTQGGHQILGGRLVGSGIQKTVFEFDETEDECFLIGGDTLANFEEGSGAEKFTVKNTATGDKIGIRYSSCSHAKNYELEAEDFSASTGIGHCWQNESGRWTESGWYLGFKATNCLRSYKFRQKSGDAGTASMAYNRLTGTVSELPVGGIGFDLDDGVSWYGCDTDINLYMDDDASAIGVNIAGKLNHGRARFAGETPGGGSHSAFTVTSTGEMREQQIHAVFENGTVDIDPSATLVNNSGVIASTGAGDYVVFETRHAVAARLSSNTAVASATWVTLTGWTEESERPSGVNNFASGVFTAPQRGMYEFDFSACFTPAIGDRCAIRIDATDRDYVLGQDIAETTDDMIVSGSARIFLDAGDTVSPQVYTDNGSGDTIRASDSDGSKTLFSYEYVSQ
jgi:hypothetical protein